MAPSIGARMDRMYRYQRHVYDLSRRFYLLGRDDVIRRMGPVPGERICEVGCGTARNLIALARRYPAVEPFGLDASNEMLKTARREVARAGLSDRIQLRLGTAEQLDPGHFGLAGPFDRVLFSYSLSMIDDWRGAIRRALDVLAPGGSLHVVDFGDAAAWPGPARPVLRWWLSCWDVRLGPAIPTHFAGLAALGRGRLDYQPLFGGYAFRLTLHLYDKSQSSNNNKHEFRQVTAGN